jgi:hypothetical protein
MVSEMLFPGQQETGIATTGLHRAATENWGKPIVLTNDVKLSEAYQSHHNMTLTHLF